MRRPVVYAALLALVVLAGAIPVAREALARARTAALLRLVPTLDPGLARHLANDSEAAWYAHARASGVRPLMDALNAAYRVAFRWPYPEFVRKRARYEHVARRLGAAEDAVYGYRATAHYYRMMAALSDSADYALHQLNRAYVAALTDPLPAPERLARLDRVLAALHARGDRNQAMSVQFSAASLELDAGHRDRFRARLQAALSEARALEDDYLVCQILGVLADVHESAGHRDSMRSCLAEGITLARRHRFPDQTARLMLFDARRAAAEGRLAVAADRLIEGQELLESYGGGSARLHLAIEYARFMADQGDWDLAREGLRRLPPLMRAFPRRTEADELLKYRFDIDCLRARAAFADGDTARGGGLLRPWLSTLPPWYRRLGTAVVFQEWSWGLQRAGNWAEALATCERGLAHCDREHVPEIAVPLALRRVVMLERLSRLGGATTAAADAKARIAASTPGDPELLAAWRVASARIALHAGRRMEGRRGLREALLTRGDPALRSGRLRAEDLEGLSACDASHELAGLTAEQGYGFELRCRALLAGGGRGRAATGDPFAPTAYRGAGTHLVYHVMPRVVLRWTATARGVRLDTLAITAAQCRQAVHEAVALLEVDRSPTGAWYSQRLHATLGRLARAVLPLEIARAPRVEVTPDGPLALLPFEALPVASADGEAPLALRADVVYRHPGEVGGHAARGPALVVSNPRLAPDLQRRYGWPAASGTADEETRAVRARWPDATLLASAAATKRSFLERAPDAACIYIASHHVTDPRTPFVGFIPLSAPPGSPGDASLLESVDVRGLALSRCRLAVLASCASGAGGRRPGRPSASLGDAFLDAGAASVVSSFWDVEDTETRAFMRELLAHPAIERDPVHTLNEARRQLMRGPNPKPPRVWAAWAVSVNAPAK